MKSITQFIKYGTVGISNTLLTAFLIWFMLDIIKVSDFVANPIGYILGFINSYYWNKKWTFQNKEHIKKTFIKFGVVFGISFGIQYILLYVLIHFSYLQSFYCQLISLVLYSVINFLLNKFYTFKLTK
mgnify:CR=1 FL=1